MESGASFVDGAHADAVPATAAWSGDSLQVRLAGPLRGIAAGQAVVLYDGDRVLGGGVIERGRRALPVRAA